MGLKIMPTKAAIFSVERVCLQTLIFCSQQVMTRLRACLHCYDLLLLLGTMLRPQFCFHMHILFRV